MILYYKRLKPIHITKNIIIIKILFYFFKNYLREKIIISHLNHLITLIFCSIKSKQITNKASK